MKHLRSSLAFLIPLALASVCASAAEPCQPVLLDQRKVIDICWTSGSVSAGERARTISGKLRRIAGDPLAQPFTTHRDEFTTAVMSGESVIASVFDGDAKYAGRQRDQLAELWAAAFNAEIAVYRQEHARERVIRRAVAAIIILALTTAGLLLIRRGTRRGIERAGALLRRRIESADTRLRQLIPAKAADYLVKRMFGLLRLVASAAVVYLALQLLLGLSPTTRHIAERMFYAALAPMRSFGAALIRQSPSIVFVLVVALCTLYVLRLNRYLFRKIADGTITIQSLRPVWASTTQRLVGIFIVLLALVIAYPYIPGSESAAFKGVSLFIGVLISLGSTGIVSNLVAGILLTYLDAFEPGHYVRLGVESGFVVKTNLFTTRLRTRNNEIITVPNSIILNKHIVNYSIPGETGLIVNPRVGIGYDVPWPLVDELLKVAAHRTKSVRTDPAPFVLERSLNQFNITYELNAHLKPGVQMYAAESELNRNILDAFNERGIQIMTPSYEGDPENPKIARRPCSCSAFETADLVTKTRN